VREEPNRRVLLAHLRAQMGSTLGRKRRGDLATSLPPCEALAVCNRGNGYAAGPEVLMLRPQVAVGG
jgi:hypothetical protein